ncbi:glycosyltransferase family 1 protein [Candidatus Cyanaurora vandensis]|uniref:glycosyltransferase family 4 protein n=1 Tax=Candidatus Cyanaurora vandensis TaxID=2714958 RepID=UPI00257E42E8|nr:glycosyltransferase family 1 protein [Candidatus Cyanaurora vandensis]
MRLLFNGSYLQLPQTGIATYCRNLLMQWQNKPELVAYLPPAWAGTLGFRAIPQTNHLTRLLWNQWHWNRMAGRGDVVFQPVPEGGWARGPQVSVAHDVIPLHYPELYPRKVAYFRYWVPLSLRSARQIICISQQTQRDLVTFYNLSPEKITVIPLACDRTHFIPGPKATRTPYLLYLGAHEPHKNLVTLLDSFRALSQTWAGSLWVGGRFDPRYTPQLQARVADLGARVRWLGYVPYADLPGLYQSATAFVFPSLYEGFGLPVLEAMACGTPVVSAHTSSLPEVGGQAVAYFEPRSVAELMGVLERVVGDAGYRDHLRNQGLARAAQFDWSITAAKTWAVCQAVAEK